MTKKKTGVRQLKKKILELLNHVDFEKGLKEICRLPAKQVVSPLFSFFYHKNQLIKWRAITAMGVVVSSLAEHNMEAARIVMRRLIWNLNDESGGIGWGSPEAMGEIMARHSRLAEEYHKILISYIMPDGNFIEHEVLQRGVLWGLGRLAHARPHLIKDSAKLLLPYMESQDPTLRGLAAWTVGIFNCKTTNMLLKRLEGDEAILTIYLDGRLEEVTVGKLARDSKR